MLSEKRDKEAVLKFFKKAINSHGSPETVNIDKSGSNTSALNHINALYWVAGLWMLVINIRQNKYLNIIVEQDHRGIKRVLKTSTWFKSFSNAADTLAGIELHRMLKKGQMKNSDGMTVWEQFYSLAA